MIDLSYDVAVIGAGPAGLAAAIAAREAGAEKVVILERDTKPGGILQQCIHMGFGVSLFGEELSGPEFAARFIRQAQQADVQFHFSCTVLRVDPTGIILCVSPHEGMRTIHAKAIVLAMGCRERTRGQVRLPGTRPAGVFTAGAAQRLINRQNLMVGRKIVILGSGDIGMIMARRFTLEGAQVHAVVEIMSYLTGLTRNRVQCLEDFNIPLLLSHTVTEVLGRDRVEGVKIAQVDEKRQPLLETERTIECDTLLLSVGLIPENELSLSAGIVLNPVTGGPKVNQHMQTSIPSVFACGNVVHVNDLVDNVCKEAALAGKSAAHFAKGSLLSGEHNVQTFAGAGVNYIVPSFFNQTQLDEELTMYFRVTYPARNVCVRALSEGAVLFEKKRSYINPGEMEHITIKSSMLKSDTLTIMIAGGEAYGSA